MTILDGIRVDADADVNGHEAQTMAPPDARRRAALLSVIVPTRNEASGMAALLEKLSECLPSRSEVIFVDDSDDATGFCIRRLVEAQPELPFEVRLVHRPSGTRRDGLGGAVAAGLRRARGEWVCVMDADLQHPPAVISAMQAVAREQDVDLVVGSRYVGGGSDAALPPSRRAASRTLAELARLTLPERLREISDPLSGFFMVRRAKVDADVLRPRGFKILLEILGRFPDLKVAEVGYEFNERYAGFSKASVREGARYMSQLAALRGASRGDRLPANPYCYSIHGLLTVSSDQRLPELAAFRVRTLPGLPDIDVRSQSGRPAAAREVLDLTQAEPVVRYREAIGRTGFAVDLRAGDQLDVRVSSLVSRSPHVLYTNVVEPLLRWQLVKRGFALVHAAAIEGRDGACLITARTDTGKTTTMLKLLDRASYRFLSDDLVLLDASGRTLCFPKPLTISRHTVHAMRGAELTRSERIGLVAQSRIHSRNGRRFAFGLAQKRLPVASLNALVQIVVPPPKYEVGRLVPGVEIGHESKVTSLTVIERGPEEVRRLSTDEAIELLVANCADAYGFPPYDTLEGFFYAIDGTRFQDAERKIITSALQGVPAEAVSSSRMAWADHIAESTIPLGGVDGAEAATHRIP